MRVERLMKEPAVARGPNASLADAARLMWDHDIGCVAVVDSGHRPIGLVTDRDICMAALHSGRALGELSVSSAMSRDLATCRPTDTVQFAEELMAQRQVRRLPVVDAAGRLVGMLSLTDLARASLGPGRAVAEAEARELAQTYAAVGRPRLARA